MFNIPAFLYQLPNVALIHEDPSQDVQGGLPGEHYHLSATAYQGLLNLLRNPTYAEPIMTRGGAIMTALSGDIMMQMLNLSAGNSSGGGTTAPTVSGSPVSIPDIVTPPVPTSAPLPAPSGDSLWSYVAALTSMKVPTATVTIPILDQYNSQIFISGNSTGWHGLPDYPLFGNNTGVTLDVLGRSIFSVVTPKQWGQIALINGQFCFEQTVARINSNDNGFLWIGYQGYDGVNIYRQFTNSLCVELQADGTGKFGNLLQDAPTSAGRTWDPNPGKTATFHYPTVAGQFYHFCLERVGDPYATDLTLYINGRPQGMVNMPGGFCQMRFVSQIFGPMRYTCYPRYKGAFTPPAGPYPVGK